MAREIWAALSGGVRALNQLDRTANNLANLQTTAYKGDRPVFRVKMADGAAGVDPNTAVGRLAQMYATLDEDRVDWSQGHLQATNRAYDFALGGAGFFQLQVDEGSPPVLTRDGTFHRSSDGYLVASDGARVLDNVGQPITLPTEVADLDIQVSRAGEIYVDGQVRATLGIFTVDDLQRVEKQGGNRFVAQEGTEIRATGGDVLQGHLEASNVEPVRAITELIAIQRYYEAFQKTTDTIANMEQQLHNRVGTLTG